MDNITAKGEPSFEELTKCLGQLWDMINTEYDKPESQKILESWEITPFEFSTLSCVLSKKTGVDNARRILGQASTLQLKKLIIFYDELNIFRDPLAVNEIMQFKKPIQKLIGLLALPRRGTPDIPWSWLSSAISVKSLQEIDRQIQEYCDKLGLDYADAMFYNTNNVFITKSQPKKATKILQLRITKQSWLLIQHIMPKYSFQRIYGYARCRDYRIPHPKVDFRFNFGVVVTGTTKEHIKRDKRTNDALRKLEEKLNVSSDLLSL